MSSVARSVLNKKEINAVIVLNKNRQGKERTVVKKLPLSVLLPSPRNILAEGERGREMRVMSIAVVFLLSSLLYLIPSLRRTPTLFSYRIKKF